MYGEEIIDRRELVRDMPDRSRVVATLKVSRIGGNEYPHFSATAHVYEPHGTWSGAAQGEGQEYDDVRDAAAAAVAVARAWRAGVGRKLDGGLPFRCLTLALNSACYPSMADALTASELVAWARGTRSRSDRRQIK